MYKSLFLLSTVGLASTLIGANKTNGAKETCAPTPPATCYPDDCKHCYCLGPTNTQGNAPVYPKTCDGDFMITVAGFYWNSHIDGMEYAVSTNVINPGQNPGQTAIQQLNNLVGGTYYTPNFKWDFGFKVGLGYSTSCDGWDLQVIWTWYKGKANGHIEAESDDNQTLLPLWSAFAPAQGFVLYATDIEHNWKLRLNLIDIELGRQYWTSKYLALRPHIGLRIAYIKQNFDIFHKGGSWSARLTTPQQNAFNNHVDMKNNFDGVGVRAGLNSEWNLGCGFAIYGNWAASIVYGRFSVKDDEENRIATAPAAVTQILETTDTIKGSRAMLDLALGVQWSTMFCDCKYGFTGMIGWENHLFFHQNQLWRVVRVGDTNVGFTNGYNNTGENSIDQSRGTLDVEGVTLTLKFEF